MTLSSITFLSSTKILFSLPKSLIQKFISPSMFRSLSFLVFILFTSLTSNAQYYSGKFSNKPSLKEFQHFIVMENARNDAFKGKLNVKAFTKTGEIWHGPALQVNANTLNNLTIQFSSSIEVKSAYKLEIERRSLGLLYDWLLG